MSGFEGSIIQIKIVAFCAQTPHLSEEVISNIWQIVQFYSVYKAYYRIIFNEKYTALSFCNTSADILPNFSHPFISAFLLLAYFCFHYW